MTAAVTATWPLDRLIAALARAGWDTLDGRAGGGPRAVLRALSDLLPHGSATGHVTAPQIADAAGLSERWTRTTLARLEDAGIISWTRGTIINGRPTASLIRVSKRVIADLVNKARPSHDSKIAARAMETARRIRETLRKTTLWPRRTPDLAAPARVAVVRPELSSTLSPTGEVTGTRVGSSGPVPDEMIAGFRQQLRDRLAMARAVTGPVVGAL